MPVLHSRLRAHAVEWHMAPAAHVDATHRADFLALQRRCNTEICRHGALTRNHWLDTLEAGTLATEPLLASLQQLAILLRQLCLVREQHTLHLSTRLPTAAAEPAPAGDKDSGVAVVICFDAHGVPWCPPLPGQGLGDPYVMSERLHDWWQAWQQATRPCAWGHAQGRPETRQLCEHLDQHYNHSDSSKALGTLMAIENSMSTDFWRRLGLCLQQHCSEQGLRLPDAGFFPVAETHARLQARHGLYLIEAASFHDSLEAETFFRASRHMLEQLEQFWRSLARLTPRPH